ncbi:MAG TPA: GDSL-type esterase/lipase family protein, partial [Ramlibacter sp.]
MNSARITAVALLFGAGALLAEQARRLGRARAWAACSLQAYSCERQPSRQRVILLGDSTGVGVGCASPGESIAARLAREHPQAHVTNLCVSGAVIGDVLAAATALPAEPVDLVVVLAGGNDVLRWTPLERLHEQTLDLHRLLRMRARHVVWAGMANVGRAPLFLPPFSWLLSARARAVSRLLHACAQRTGVRFVDFFRGARADLFSAKPELYYGA